MSSSNLKELARSRGTNVKRLAEQCGIPPSTLYAIANGSTNFGNVGIDLFLKIAAALDMSAEELYRISVVGDAEEKASAGPDLLEGRAFGATADERELATIFRSLPEQGKRQLMIFARGCSATFPLIKE